LGGEEGKKAREKTERKRRETVGKKRRAVNTRCTKIGGVKRRSFQRSDASSGEIIEGKT
jgi:hypothetical protein